MSRRQRRSPCMVDLVDCFQDFVKKSLIFISLVVCTVAALLVYAVKLIIDRNRSHRNSIAPRRVSNEPPPGTQRRTSTLPSTQLPGCLQPKTDPTSVQTPSQVPPMCKEFLAIIDKLDCQKRETVDRQFEESNKKVDECKFKIEESNRKLEECHKKVEESKCIVEQSNKKVDECCKRLEQCNKIVEELKVKSSGKGEMPIKGCAAMNPPENVDPCCDNAIPNEEPSINDMIPCTKETCKNLLAQKCKELLANEETSNKKKKKSAKKNKEDKNTKKKLSKKYKNSSDETLCDETETLKKCIDICGKKSDSSQKKACCVTSSLECNKNLCCVKNCSKVDESAKNVCCLKRIASKPDEELSGENSCYSNERSLYNVKNNPPKINQNYVLSDDLCCIEKALSRIDQAKDACDADSSQKSRKPLQCYTSSEELFVRANELCTKNVKNEASTKEKDDQILRKESSSNSSSNCSIESEQVDPCACSAGTTLPPIIIIHNLEN